MPSSEQKRITKQNLIDLEEKILLALEFSIHYAGPIPFIERFQRILEADKESEDVDLKQVGFTARQFCKYMQRYGQFLEWKPSQVAAAAIILSLNLNNSHIGSQVGLRPLVGGRVRQILVTPVASTNPSKRVGGS